MIVICLDQWGLRDQDRETEKHRRVGQGVVFIGRQAKNTMFSDGSGCKYNQEASSMNTANAHKGCVHHVPCQCKDVQKKKLDKSLHKYIKTFDLLLESNLIL